MALLTGAGVAAGLAEGPAPGAGHMAGVGRVTGNQAASSALTAALIGSLRADAASSAQARKLPWPAVLTVPPVAGRAHVIARGPASSPRPSASGRPSQSTTPSQPPAQPPAPSKPYLIYDSVTPSAIPAGVVAATYAATVPAAAMAGRPTIWIDAHGTDPAASVLDVEPGNATPGMVAAWVTARLNLAGPAATARIYTMISEWPACQQAVATLPAWTRARVRWWIADPTGVNHMVPGADATQWYWGPSYDISTANPDF